jgi:PAS domain S-box-containing protein
MIENVEHGSKRPLDDVHRRLEAVLSNASGAIFLMDERQHCIYMNRAAEELTGYTFAEVLDLDRPLHDIIHHTHPDGRPFAIEECAIDRAFPEHNQTRGEEIFVHRDSTFYPVGFTASPIRDEGSKTIGTIIEVRNITSEKMAAERQQMLLDELNHRVKNTLTTVQALAHNTFRYADPEAFYGFMGRLSTLSEAHNILTQAAWHKGSVREIAVAACAPFGLERFELEGKHCDVHPKVAVSLAMVLHELGTNAVKYGALARDEGQVKIHWSCARSGETSRLLMSWEESGGPPVVLPTRRGFGSRLIERHLALEFGGDATLDFKTSGLKCSIDLQMPAGPEFPLETSGGAVA